MGEMVPNKRGGTFTTNLFRKYMTSFELNDLNNFIAGWYIDTSICNEIVELSDKNKNQFSSGIKEYTNYDLMQLDNVLHDQYCEQLHQVIEHYKNLYPLCYRDLHVWGWSAPRIQRYEPGQYYRVEHCENNGLTLYRSRHLAYMTYLNSITDGGGTEFIHQNLITSAIQGLTLIWPAGWTHYHKGVVSHTEVKYIITGWLCFYPDNIKT